MVVIDPEVKTILEEINKLSEKANKDPNAYTLKSMQDHADEIKELFEKRDEHWKAESADMLIHCLLLMKRNGMEISDMDNIIDKRFGRFKERIREGC